MWIGKTDILIKHSLVMSPKEMYLVIYIMYFIYTK